MRHRTKVAIADEAVAVVRARYEAYAAKDQSAIEALIADDFHFTSLLDNCIDRATYMKRCWPNSETVKSFELIHLVQCGERVFVTYNLHNTDGSSFRSSEIVTVRSGQIVDVEAYLGWPIPHEAPAGGFVFSTQK